MRRDTNTITGKAGIIAIRTYCNANSLIFYGEPEADEDYGIDLLVQLDLDGDASPYTVGVQSKAGTGYRRRFQDAEGTFSIYPEARHVAHWLRANYPVFFLYWDPERSLLFYKHVQAAAAAGGDAGLRRFDFTRDDLVNEGDWAGSIRALAASTATTASIQEVVSAPLSLSFAEIEVEAGSERMNLEQPMSLDELFAPLVGLEFGTLSPATYVLGYSENQRWIAEFFATGAQSEVRIIDTTVWNCFAFGLERQQLGRAATMADWMASADRVHAGLEAALLKLRFRSPSRLLWRPAYAFGETLQHVVLSFGGHSFEVGVAHRPGVDALELSSREFQPNPIATIATERLDYVPLQMAEPSYDDDDPFGDAYAERFQMVCDAAVSPDGHWLTIGIASREHACAGEAKMRRYHFRVSALRAALASGLQRHSNVLWTVL